MSRAKKSTVNKAGNYTKPAMRKRQFQRIKAGSKEKMRKKGQKGRPTKANFRSAAKSARKKKV